MKVMLVFPPDWDLEGPYLALPCLAAALRRAGVTVDLQDLNIAFYDSMLRPERLEALAAELEPGFVELDSRATLSDRERRRYLEYARDVHVLPLLAGRIREALDTVRTPGAIGGDPGYADAYATVRLACSVIRRTLARPGIDPRSTDDVLAAAVDPEPSPFFRFLQERFIATVLRERPRVIGISITGSQQLLPGMSVARAIRRSGVGAHIVVGGAAVSEARQALESDERWYDLVDSFLFHEAESSMVELVDAVGRGREPGGVHPSSWRSGGRICTNRAGQIEDLDRLPCPSYQGLPLESYLTPEPMLAVTGARGCWWGRCSFCSLNHSFHQAGVRYRSPHLVVDDMAELQARHGARHFYVAGNGIPPSRLGALATELLERGLDVAWTCEARIHPGLDETLLRLLARSGLCRIKYGLESGNARVLSAMSKGYSPGLAEPLIERTARCGVAPHIYVIVGFPGETRQEHQDTIDLVRRQQGSIFSLAVSPFALARHSPVARHPERFGVRIHDLRGLELASILPYETTGPGLCPASAARAADALQRSFWQGSRHPEAEVYGFHLASIFAVERELAPAAATGPASSTAAQGQLRLAPTARLIRLSFDPGALGEQDPLFIERRPCWAVLSIMRGLALWRVNGRTARLLQRVAAGTPVAAGDRSLAERLLQLGILVTATEDAALSAARDPGGAAGPRAVEA